MLRRKTRELDAEAAQKEAALKNIAANPAPPEPLQTATVTVKPPTEDDFTGILRSKYKKKDPAIAVPDAKIAEIREYLFGNVQQTFAIISKSELQNIKQDYDEYINTQRTDANENPRVTSYRANVINTLTETLQMHEKAIKQSIGAEVKNIASDEKTAQAAAILQKLLVPRYEILLVYQSLASTIYNAAIDYYRNRWEASHSDFEKLKAECAAFNNIFGSFAHINDDFTLSPYQATLDFIGRNRPQDLETLLTDLIKAASYNKLDDNKSAFTALITQINTLGEYFKPVSMDDKKFNITFFDEVTKTFETYIKCRVDSDQITDIDLDLIQRYGAESKARVEDFARNVSDTAVINLQTARNNISIFSEIINQEAEIHQAITSVLLKLQPIDEKIRPFTAAPNHILEMGLPQHVAAALIHLFNSGISGTKKKSVEEADKIHQTISRINIDTTKIIADAETTSETLQPIKTIEYLQAIKNELGQVENKIDSLDRQVTAALRLDDLADEMLNHIQDIHTSAQQASKYYQDFRNEVNGIDYFSEDSGGEKPFTTTIEKIAVLRANRLYSYFPNEVKVYLNNIEEDLENHRKNFSIIMRCHLLLNSALNFKYWKSKGDKNIKIISGNSTYAIPEDILLMLEIAKKPEFQAWSYDPETARRLLSAIQHFANSRQCKSVKVRAFLAAAHKSDHDPIIFSNDKNNVTRSMFFLPFKLIRQGDVTNFERKPSFWQKHPIAKQVCLGIAWSLFALGIAAVVVGILMIPGGPIAATLTAFAATASAAVGGPAIFGTLLGIGAAIITGIGAGIGYLVGKVKYAREQRRQAAIAAAKPASRPPMPSTLPREPEVELARAVPNTARPQNTSVCISASRNAFHQPVAAAKPLPLIVDKKEFEKAIADEMINVYAGQEGVSGFHARSHEHLTRLWDDCSQSLIKFIERLERTRPMTAKSIISQSVTKLFNQYPHMLNEYPANSLIKNKIQAPARQNSLRRN